MLLSTAVKQHWHILVCVLHNCKFSDEMERLLFLCGMPRVCMYVCTCSVCVCVLSSVAMCNLLLEHHYIINKTGAHTKSRLTAAILVFLSMFLVLHNCLDTYISATSRLHCTISRSTSLTRCFP